MKDLNTYRDLLDKCSHCQFCQATCPVYQADLLESHGPRARAQLIEAALLEKRLPVSDRVREIVDRCLLCGSCRITCPAAVPVEEIVTAARHEIYGGKRRSRVRRMLMKKLMADRGPDRGMKTAGAMAKALGMSPEGLPDPAPKTLESVFSSTIPAEGTRRATVAYFVGCATHALYPDTGADVVRVLAKNGIEVIIPENLSCCGIPALADGDLDTGREMVRNNLEVLSALQADAIITDCTSCLLMLKEKAPVLIDANDPLRDQVQAVSEKAWEATDYLIQIGLTFPPGPLAERCTYHIPCHGKGNAPLKAAPRRLMTQLPDAELVEMDEADTCCGAGGSFFMEHRALAESIRDRKLNAITETGADILMTQCPACRTFLSDGLSGKTVMHPLSLLARAYGFPAVF